jgi:hypothetical protein
MKITTVAVALTGTLLAAGALAQDTPPMGQGGGGMMQMTPMPGMPMPPAQGGPGTAPQMTPGAPSAQTQGMCGGMCGMGGSAQGTPAGGGMTCGCSMLRQHAGLEGRLRQLEERAGISSPPQAQPDAPPAPR